MRTLILYTAKKWRNCLVIPAILAAMSCNPKALAAPLLNIGEREIDAKLELNRRYLTGSQPFTFERYFKVAQTTDQVFTETINLTSSATSLGGRQFIKDSGDLDPYTLAFSDFLGFVGDLGKTDAIQDRGNGLYTVVFDDGSSASVRPFSSGDLPTIQINLVNSSTPYKIRYQQTSCPATATATASSC